MRLHFIKIKIKNNSAFTLIEMAAVIVIAGLIIGSISTAYTSYLQTRHIRYTYERMQKVSDRLQDFYNSQGRYPCPSSPETMDGVENCTVSATTVNARSTDYPGAQLAYVGSVPYDTLMRGINDTNPYTNPPEYDDNQYIEEDKRVDKRDTIDDWDRQITYVVPVGLTSQNTFKPEYASIGILNEFEKSLVSPSGTAAWVLISHGEDGAGAYSTDGVKNAINTCLGKEAEYDNCDLSPASGDTITIVSGVRNAIRGTNFFDDIVMFGQASGLGYWTKARNDPTSSRSSASRDITNLNIGYVGVGNDSPVEKLDLTGNSLMANNVYVSQYCNEYGSNCNLFNPNNFISKSASGKVINGINSDGTLSFTTLTPTPISFNLVRASACTSDVTGACDTTAGTCKAGFYAIGVNSTGQIICGNP